MVEVEESETGTLDMRLEGLFSANTTSISEDVSESEFDISECIFEESVPDGWRIGTID